jgi:hypothetical protein
VTFPDSIDVQSATQLYYFEDAAGLLSRVDYQPVINGDTPVAMQLEDQPVWASAAHQTLPAAPESPRFR